MIADQLLGTLKKNLSTLVVGTQLTLNDPVLYFGVPANQGNFALNNGGFVITVKGGTSGGASTLTLRLITSDAENLGTPTVLWTSPALTLADTVKKQLIVPVPVTDDWKRYAAFHALAGTAVFTGGTVVVDYVADIRRWRAYPAENGR